MIEAAIHTLGTQDAHKLSIALNFGANELYDQVNFLFFDFLIILLIKNYDLLDRPSKLNNKFSFFFFKATNSHPSFY